MQINKRVEDELRYLKVRKPRNIVLLGDEPEHMRLCAYTLASAWLHVEEDELIYHPDFQLVEPDNGSLRSEQAAVIQRMASCIPISGKAVCVVLHAETMTVELQNKLLKVLEDGENILSVIFVTSKQPLDTISSRCITVLYPKSSMNELFETVPHPVTEVAMMACDGSVERYEQIVGDVRFCQYLEGFLSAYRSIKERCQLKGVLKLTHALKEKDAEYLPELFSDWQMDAFLCMMESLYWHLLVIQCGMSESAFVRTGNLPNLYSRDEAESLFRKMAAAKMQNRKKGGFTKNDFFALLMAMIPLEKQKEG